ncbi:uncharacterized protein LOC113505237 [Trichoplusia ni]|uniref:Uncharacterized protein LOC113505237 n=1 Tax=Trichoplusia ni TaxID=7111 RepID=A0A7E5WS93_TRINI|nr:uncharacterized protein LOC113505237 [Trichoplusia ni]
MLAFYREGQFEVVGKQQTIRVLDYFWQRGPSHGSSRTSGGPAKNADVYTPAYSKVWPYTGPPSGRTHCADGKTLLLSAGHKGPLHSGSQGPIAQWVSRRRALWRERPLRSSRLGCSPGCTTGRRGRGREEAREAITQHWADDLASATFGRRTLDAIGPVLKDWLDRRHGCLSLRLVQVLSGHGCFGSYLHRIGREETPQCHHCEAAVDTAEHTLEVCPSWDAPHRTLMSAVGDDLSLPSVIAAMLGSAEAWEAVASFCEVVMSQKKAAERMREDDPLAAPFRRRRRGGRR